MGAAAVGLYLNSKNKAAQTASFDGGYANATGPEMNNQTKCAELMNHLMQIKETMESHNVNQLSGAQMTTLMNNKMFILSQLQKFGCKDK